MSKTAFYLIICITFGTGNLLYAGTGGAKDFYLIIFGLVALLLILIFVHYLKRLLTFIRIVALDLIQFIRRNFNSDIKEEKDLLIKAC